MLSELYREVQVMKSMIQEGEKHYIKFSTYLKAIAECVKGYELKNPPYQTRNETIPCRKVQAHR